MSDNKKIITVISLVVVITFSMLLFFGTGNFDKTGIQISSFIFIIITELVAFCNVFLLTNKKLNTFARAGLSSIAGIYIASSLLFNILLSGLFRTVRSVLVFNFAILLLYIFIALVVIFFKKEGNK